MKQRCYFHKHHTIQNFCILKQCTLPLCSQCLPIHEEEHKNKEEQSNIINYKEAYERADREIHSFIHKNKQQFSHFTKQVQREKENAIKAVENYYSSFLNQVQNSPELQNLNQVEQKYSKFKKGSIKTLIYYYSGEINLKMKLNTPQVRSLSKYINEIINQNSNVNRKNYDKKEQIQTFRQNTYFPHQNEDNNIKMHIFFNAEQNRDAKQKSMKQHNESQSSVKSHSAEKGLKRSRKRSIFGDKKSNHSKSNSKISDRSITNKQSLHTNKPYVDDKKYSNNYQNQRNETYQNIKQSDFKKPSPYIKHSNNSQLRIDASRIKNEEPFKNYIQKHSEVFENQKVSNKFSNNESQQFYHPKNIIMRKTLPNRNSQLSNRSLNLKPQQSYSHIEQRTSYNRTVTSNKVMFNQVQKPSQHLQQTENFSTNKYNKIQNNLHHYPSQISLNRNQLGNKTQLKCQIEKKIQQFNNDNSFLDSKFKKTDAINEQQNFSNFNRRPLRTSDLIVNNKQNGEDSYSVKVVNKQPVYAFQQKFDYQRGRAVSHQLGNKSNSHTVLPSSKKNTFEPLNENLKKQLMSPLQIRQMLEKRISQRNKILTQKKELNLNRNSSTLNMKGSSHYMSKSKVNRSVDKQMYQQSEVKKYQISEQPQFKSGYNTKQSIINQIYRQSKY